MTGADLAREVITCEKLSRDLMLLPRGGKQWRAAYSAYRKTAHWKTTNAAQLAAFPFCAMEELMTGMKIHADESHHRATDRWFNERIGIDLVSVSKANHLLWEMRRLRRNRR